jgi:hypothetical protein
MRTGAALVVAACLSGAAHGQLLPAPRAVPAPTASAVASAAEIAGVWSGKYICTQGITALRLELIDIGAGRVRATFQFGPLPENPLVPEGAYTMTGWFDPAGRRLVLRQEAWTRHPQGYVMVDLDGRLVASRDLISGHIVTDDRTSCSWFQVVRRDEPIA